MVAACDVVSPPINPSASAVLAVSLLPVRQPRLSRSGAPVVAFGSQQVEVNILPPESARPKPSRLICQQPIRAELPLWSAKVVTLRLMAFEGASKLAQRYEITLGAARISEPPMPQLLPFESNGLGGEPPAMGSKPPSPSADTVPTSETVLSAPRSAAVVASERAGVKPRAMAVAAPTGVKPALVITSPVRRTAF